jgi:S-adenosylmethionine:tRNA ribosyltransferase-isomerase
LKLFQNISPDQFHYELPEERIAIYPSEIRDRSRLLIRKRDGMLLEDVFLNIADYLEAGSHLFFNNSKVIPARLVFTKDTGSSVEIFCLRPVDPVDYALSLSASDSVIWECMIGNLKRFKSSNLQMNISSGEDILVVNAEKLEVSGNTGLIKFTWNNPDVSFAEILTRAGHIPLPPYIKRASNLIDKERYQTIYSKTNGSVAAPTAGLHFTKEVLNRIADKGIITHEVTLHVGAGTFLPIKSKQIANHEMHAEFFEVDRTLVDLLSLMPDKVACVGTTTVRTIESLYWIGVKILSSSELLSDLYLDQWDPYNLPDNYSIKQSFEALSAWLEKKKIRKTMASTRLMIVPGYHFKTVNKLITNFHQPGSTLLLLIAAFIGESWKESYRYALENDFRFLSYGDSSLLFNPHE